MKDHIEVSLPKPEPKHIHITFRAKNLGTLISQFISTFVGSVFFLIGGILYYQHVIIGKSQT